MASDDIPALAGELEPPPVAIGEPTEVVERPREAVLKEIPLEGEGSDRAFITADGFRVRARVVLGDTQMVRVPTSAKHDTAPTQTTLHVTVAALTEGGQVRKSGDLYMVSDVYEVQFTDEAMARGADLSVDIFRGIAILAARMEDVAKAKAKAARMLKRDWGL